MSDLCFGPVDVLAGQETPLATVATVATVPSPAQESVATVAAVATPPRGTNAGGNGQKAGPKPDLVRAIRCVEDYQACFEERAAIRDYDGGLPRDEAERLAIEDVVSHYYGSKTAAKGTK